MNSRIDGHGFLRVSYVCPNITVVIVDSMAKEGSSPVPFKSSSEPQDMRKLFFSALCDPFIPRSLFSVPWTFRPGLARLSGGSFCSEPQICGKRLDPALHRAAVSAGLPPFDRKFFKTPVSSANRVVPCLFFPANVSALRTCSCRGT